jgi:hypothetical protein
MRFKTALLVTAFSFLPALAFAQTPVPADQVPQPPAMLQDNAAAAPQAPTAPGVQDINEEPVTARAPVDLPPTAPSAPPAVVTDQSNPPADTSSPGQAAMPDQAAAPEQAPAPVVKKKKKKAASHDQVRASAPISSWNGMVDGKQVVALGSADNANQAQGTLVITNAGDNSSSKSYNAPSATGPLQIMGQSGDYLLLESIPGGGAIGQAMYKFNLKTRQFE